MDLIELLKVVSGGGAVVALLAGIWVLYFIFDRVLTKFLEKIDQIEERHERTTESFRITLDTFRLEIIEAIKRNCHDRP